MSYQDWKQYKYGNTTSKSSTTTGSTSTGGTSKVGTSHVNKSNANTSSGYAAWLEYKYGNAQKNTATTTTASTTTQTTPAVTTQTTLDNQTQKGSLMSKLTTPLFSTPTTDRLTETMNNIDILVDATKKKNEFDENVTDTVESSNGTKTLNSAKELKESAYAAIDAEKEAKIAERKAENWKPEQSVWNMKDASSAQKTYGEYEDSVDKNNTAVDRYNKAVSAYNKEVTDIQNTDEKIASLLERQKELESAVAYNQNRSGRSGSEYGVTNSGLRISTEDAKAELADIEKQLAELGYDEVNWGRLSADTALLGVNGIDRMVSSALDWLVGSPLRALGRDTGLYFLEETGLIINDLNEQLKKEGEAAESRIAENTKYNTGAAVASELGVGVIEAIPMAAIAFATGGASLATSGAALTSTGVLADTAGALATKGLGYTISNSIKQMAKDPNYWSSFFMVAGQNYEDAKEDGATELQACSYAMINGLVSAIVEIGGGGIQNVNAKGLKEWVFNAIDEGKEEVVQGIIERGLQNVVYNKGNALGSWGDDQNAIFNLKTGLKEFGMGAAVGGILSGATMTTNAILQNKEAKNAIKQLQKEQEMTLIVQGQQFAEGSQTRQIADRMMETLNGFAEAGDTKAIENFFTSKEGVEAIDALRASMIEEFDESAPAEYRGTEEQTRQLSTEENDILTELTNQGLSGESTTTMANYLAVLAEGGEVSNNALAKTGLLKNTKFKAAVESITGVTLNPESNSPSAMARAVKEAFTEYRQRVASDQATVIGGAVAAKIQELMAAKAAYNAQTSQNVRPSATENTTVANVDNTIYNNEETASNSTTDQTISEITAEMESIDHEMDEINRQRDKVDRAKKLTLGEKRKAELDEKRKQLDRRMDEIYDRWIELRNEKEDILDKNNKGGTVNGGEQSTLSSGISQRDGGTVADGNGGVGEQGAPQGNVAERTEGRRQAERDARHARAAARSKAAARITKTTSPRALGLINGVEDSNVIELSEKDIEQLKKDDAIRGDVVDILEDAKKKGVNVKLVYGAMEVVVDNKTGLTRIANGVNINNDTIIIQLDDEDMTALQIYLHESGHIFLNTHPGAIQLFISKSGAWYNEVLEAYALGHFQTTADKLTEKQKAYLADEIFCDANGNFDTYTGTDFEDLLPNASDLTEAARSTIENWSGEAVTETSEEEGVPEGPMEEDVTSDVVDPGQNAVVQFSYRSLAEAAGFQAVFPENGDPRYWARPDGSRVDSVSVDDIKHSLIGKLVEESIGHGINAEQAEQEYLLFSKICSMAVGTNDFSLSMAAFGSTMFTALKANSDKQYKTTFDFVSICQKTQAVIDLMSEEMVKKKRGLYKSEILQCYDKVFASGNPVPCPECYVFAKWIGIGGMLNKIKKFQTAYADYTAEEMSAVYDEALSKVLEGQKALNENREPDKKVTKGQAKIKIVKDMSDDFEELDEKVKRGDELTKSEKERYDSLQSSILDIQALTWIDDVFFADAAHTVKRPVEDIVVPDEILFDLNRGGEFAERYSAEWKFRTSLGNAYGKAIAPYAEETLGEGILGTVNLSERQKQKENNGRMNFRWLNKNGELTKEAKTQIAKARKKQKTQLFLGGQRFQSTSDAVYENASDYLLAALEMQVMQGGVQVYTKVDGAVPAFATWGFLINQSLMPKGGGLDAKGVPEDTVTGGMSVDAAKANRDKYTNAGTITIGVNDNHIRAMFDQYWRDFIIPYHASGNKQEMVASMRAVQDAESKGVSDKNSTDYTFTQSDRVLSDVVLRNVYGYTEEQIAQIQARREARIVILTGADKKTGKLHKNLDMSVVNSNRFLKELYARFNGGEWTGVSVTKETIEHQIFPNEFWDKSVTYKESGKITADYLEYCRDLGFLHRFSGLIPRNGTLAKVKGKNENGETVYLTDLAYKVDENGNATETIEDFFWKTLVDHRMYDADGKYQEQPTVCLANVNAEEGAAITTTFAKRNVGRMYNPVISEQLIADVQSGKVNLDDEAELSAAAKKLGETLNFSLKPVAPVVPSSNLWTPGATTEEVRAAHPTLYAVDEEATEERNPTQVKGTVSTYRKIYDKLKSEGFNGTILDASSGMGYGTKAGIDEYGLDVEDIEPYPDTDYSPKYTDYSKLNKKYDVVISNAVLNVLPQDQRDALTVKMGELLNDGGRLFVNVRGKDVLNAKGKQTINEDGMEYFIPRTAKTGSYQKGFTKSELKAYLEDALGDGFKVETTNDFGAVSAIVTREDTPSRYVGKSMSTSKEIYDYDFLTGLPDMVVKEMPPLSSVKTDGKIDRGLVAEKGLKNAEALGRKIDNKRSAVKNDYTKREIIVTERSLTHSLDGDQNRLRTNARLSAMAGELVKYAVPVNSLVNESQTAKGTYAMASLLRSGDGYFVAVLTIEQRGESVEKVDYVDVTHAISGRIKNKSADGRLQEPSALMRSTSTDTISIADFLSVVNNTYRSLLSEDVLTHLGETRPETGLYVGKTNFSMKPQFLSAEDVYVDKTFKMKDFEPKYNVEGMTALRDKIVEIETKHYFSGRDFMKFLYEHKEVDFIQRIQDGDPNAVDDLKKSIAGMGYNQLDKMRWYPVQARSTQERKNMRSAILKYNKVINAAIEDFLNAKKEIVGRSLNVKSGSVSREEIRDLFYELNGDPTNKEIADRVFDFMTRHPEFTSDIKFRKLNPDPLGAKNAGNYIGWQVRYDTGYFNSEYYTDQRKADTLLHELIHSCTVYALWNFKNGKVAYEEDQRTEDACNIISSVWHQIKNDPDMTDSNGKPFYGLTDEYEMVAELANPEFRVALQKKGLFQRIIDAIKALLGFDTTNAYDAVSNSLYTLLDNHSYRFEDRYLAAAERKIAGKNRTQYSTKPTLTQDERMRDILSRMAAEQRESIGAAPAKGKVTRDYEDWANSDRGKVKQTISAEQVNQTAGTRANRPATNIPKVNPQGRITNMTAQTLINSSVTDEAMQESLKSALANGKFSHFKHTDAAAIQNAHKAVLENWDAAWGKFKTNAENNVASKDNIALGIELYNEAVTNGDVYRALDVASLLIKQGNSLGTALQALRMLNKLTPEGKLYMAVRSVENIVAEIRKLYGDDVAININRQLFEDYRDALASKDKAEIKKTWGAIEQAIADQIPGTWREKLNAWRYLAMLGNTRTHFRNLLGNAGFMPVRLMKQAVKAGLERVVLGKSGMGSRRTTAFLNVASSEDRARLQAGWSDYNEVRDIIQRGGKYNDTQSEVNDKRKIFKLKPLEWARDKNGKLLDAEDVWFSKPAYAEALASAMKAKGIDGDDYAAGNVAPQIREEIQALAISEAQKATYRDLNAFSETVTALGRFGSQKDAHPVKKAAHLAVEGVLPFKKTPANILVRAVEYSPIEFGIVLGNDIYAVKKGNMTVSDMLDHISSGLVGTGLLALGALLRSLGLLVGGADDDDKQAEFDTLQGQQEYAINIGDKNYTLDWLAPEALPMFVGVQMYDTLTNKEDETDTLTALLNALPNIAEPVLNMSMLQSVNDLINNISYLDDSEKIIEILKNIAGNLASQFVPTLFGQVERITEDTRYSTYVDKEGFLDSQTQRAAGKIMNKLPGEYNQVEYVDAWGRTKSTGTLAERVFRNMFSPGYVSVDASTTNDDELQRLYDAGYDAVFPTRTKQNTKVDGVAMNGDEYVQYAKLRGQTALTQITNLLSGSAYRKMSDDEKAKAIELVYEDAKTTAENAIRKSRGEGTLEKTNADKAGMSSASYATAYAVYSKAVTPRGYETTETGGTPAWAKYLAVLEDSGLSNENKLRFVNAGRDEPFDSLSDAKKYYEKKKDAAKEE